MTNRLITLLCMFLAFLAFHSNMVFGEEILTQPTRVSEHVSAWIGPYGPPTKENRGFRMNLGVVIGNDAVAVIDSGYSDAMAREMISRIEAMTDAPIRYVINTNSQPHRILGNAVFRQQGAEILSSTEAIPRITGQGAAMAERAESILDLPHGSIQPPGASDKRISEETLLDLGGTSLRVIPVGTAHTPGSLVIEVVEDKVVFTGDVLYGGRLLTILPISRVDTWISAYERLREFEAAIFVPGHGEPGTLDRFEHEVHGYLTTLMSHMDSAVDEGVGLQDAIGSLDQSAWQSLADFEMLEGRNAHQTYLEREAAAFE